MKIAFRFSKMFELWKIHSPRTRNTDDVSVAVKVIEVVKV